MKRFLLSLFSFTYVLISFAQETRTDYVPGEMYIMVSEKNFTGMLDAGKLNQRVFLETFGKYIKGDQIQEAALPFWNADNKALARVVRITMKDTTGVLSLIQQINLDPICDYAEPVPMAYLDYQPNDLRPNTLGNQWHLYKIQALEAWDISKGDKVVTVAIVDDAMQINHPDLQGNLWQNPKEIPNNGIDDDLNGFVDDVVGYDVGDGDNNPSPINSAYSHGTHVGGIVGATTDNSSGIASVGFNISLIAVKSTITGQQSTTAIPRGYEGIYYAGQAGADIINCSWSGPGFSSTGQLIVAEAIQKGSIIVAAMGNDGAQLVRYPAFYTGVVSVASTSQNDAKSSFSNYNTYTTISAPGYQILSTYTNSSYSSQSGTSMASPLVAGVLALMKSHMPTISNEKLLGCMLNNADNIDAVNPSYKDKLGAGRVNVFKGLQCVDTLRSSPPEVVFTQMEMAYCPNSPIQFTASSAAGEADEYYWEFPGGIPSTSTEANPEVVYPYVGNYSYSLTLKNSFGSSTKKSEGGIHVNANGVATILKENFDAGLSIEKWTVSGTNASKGFESIKISYSPGDTAYALWTEGYNGQTGTFTQLTSQALDFSDYTNPSINFNFAYSRRSSSALDSIYILVSTDGGASFRSVFGQAMRNINVSGSFGGSYVPSSANDWCAAKGNCQEVELVGTAGQPNVQVAFRYIFHVLGSNLYIDDVFVGGNCQKFENIDLNTVQLYPNPSQGLFLLSGLKNTIGELELYSSSGQFLGSQAMVDGPQQIDLSLYAQGMYYARWQDAEGYHTVKLLLSK
ncbi:MAG: T9SS type A sorting domain-containing protein [Bacteroidetes bacterium]|nr:MAG: T9SS type A sorting domain-containing protein [Bacteroidota bacterium]